MRAHVGSVVGGKYKLVERLGGGGMGEVFRAEHLFAGRVVALKLLRPEYTGDADLTRRFFQEAQAVNKIRHPNIVDVLDAGFSDEGPYVAMEILEGSSLAAALAQAKTFTVPLALAVVLPMLDALGAVHRQGIVHRDLKPENVFLARQFGAVMVKLVDFGIAKVHGANTRTNTGVIFGTPDYLSPEQASGEGLVDGRSDLFAVGVVLFELLTGRRPFEAETALATAYRVVNAPAPKLADRGALVDPRVQEVLDVALAKSSPDRYADAAAFGVALTPILGDQGDAARARLLELVNAVTAAAPTAARPPLAAAATVAVEGGRGAEPLPVTPVLDSNAKRGNTNARRESPTPLAPPTPPPLAPTLASNRLLTPSSPALSRLARTLATSELREPVPSPTPPIARARVSTPSRAIPEGLPLPARAPTTTPVRLSPRARDRRATVWTPRPLPAHVRGKAHARGSVARAAARWIERTHGADARDDVLRALPAELAEVYRGDGFNSLVWYDLAMLDSFLEAATALVLGGDVVAWRVLGRDHFERDLGSLFGTATGRAGDPAQALKRSVTTWPRLYDFASARIVEPPGNTGAPRALVRFDGFDAASLALRNATIGITEGLVQKCISSGEIATRVLTGEASFVRDFEFELAWPAPR